MAMAIWNSAPAIVSIQVAPMFWQTSWFHAGVTLLIVVGGVSAYRFRLRQIARRLNDRFEERLAERTRLAQELHDTLLQGVLSTSMQLHLAIDRVPQEAPARASLEHVRSLMGRVIDEGRHAVRGLRARGVDDDLERAFAQVPRDFGAHAAAVCRIAVQGSPRPMHPLIRDEIYRIGREALVNALRHSGASEIELEVDYQASHVSVTVRDDGHGIDEQVLRVGRTDHWGLLGMQERAESIGARLRVWTRRDKGTEVELTVPDVVAFTSKRAPRVVACVAGVARVQARRDAIARRAKVSIMSTSRIRVLSVDDHPLLREGIAAVINNQPDMSLVALATTGTEAVQRFREHRPDVTLMDLRLPDVSGIDAMMAIRAEFPDARVMILTSFDGDVEIERALRGRRARLRAEKPAAQGARRGDS